jgi:hypothetical protein
VQNKALGGLAELVEQKLQRAFENM